MTAPGWTGSVEGIYLAPDAAVPLEPVERVKAVEGLGLEGDRYYSKRGTFSQKVKPGRAVTLIEGETIDALRNDHGLDVSPGDARRNIVTRGVPLNHLVGATFKVGAATMVGIKLCEPCSHLAGLTSRDVYDALVHRGGLRAEIVEGAEIGVGDVVRPA